MKAWYLGLCLLASVAVATLTPPAPAPATTAADPVPLNGNVITPVHLITPVYDSKKKLVSPEGSKECSGPLCGSTKPMDANVVVQNWGATAPIGTNVVIDDSLIEQQAKRRSNLKQCPCPFQTATVSPTCCAAVLVVPQKGGAKKGKKGKSDKCGKKRRRKSKCGKRKRRSKKCGKKADKCGKKGKKGDKKGKKGDKKGKKQKICLTITMKKSEGKKSKKEEKC